MTLFAFFYYYLLLLLILFLLLVHTSLGALRQTLLYCPPPKGQINACCLFIRMGICTKWGF